MDDTTLITTGFSLSEIIHATNSDLSSTSEWLLTNKLSLNVAKTEHMLIGSDDKLSKIRDMPFVLTLIIYLLKGLVLVSWGLC